MTTLTNPIDTAVIAPVSEPEMADLEQQIETDSKAFQRVGQALIRIHEGRGYRLRGYKTFEAYCQARWDFTDRQGRRLITAAQTAAKVKEATGFEPASESVARVLASVADDPIVLQKVAEKLGKAKKNNTLATASADAVANAVAAATGKPRPAPAQHRLALGGESAPRPKGGAPALPGVGTDDVTQLQAVLTSARVFLTNHPWLKDSDDAKRVVKQLDEGQALIDKLLTATFSAIGPKPGKGVAPTAGPACPDCKQPIAPGDPFCGHCGAAL